MFSRLREHHQIRQVCFAVSGLWIVPPYLWVDKVNQTRHGINFKHVVLFKIRSLVFVSYNIIPCLMSLSMNGMYLLQIKPEFRINYFSNNIPTKVLLSVSKYAVTYWLRYTVLRWEVWTRICFDKGEVMLTVKAKYCPIPSKYMFKLSNGYTLSNELVIVRTWFD